MRRVIAVIGLLMVLACGGGGNEPRCDAWVSFDLEEYQGSGKTAAQAKDNACFRYCGTADPEFAAFFAVYADSPAGKKRGSNLKPLDMAIGSEPSLKPTFEKCVRRCLSDASVGKNGLGLKHRCP